MQAAPIHETPSRPHLRVDPLPSISASQPLVELGFKREAGVIRAEILQNTSDAVIDCNLTTHTIAVRPLKRGIRLPYFYTIEITAINMVFLDHVDMALTWNSPSGRPPFIVQPVLSSDRKTLTLGGVNAVVATQSADFDLHFTLAEHARGSWGGDSPHWSVDPTIVNNPDIGP